MHYNNVPVVVMDKSYSVDGKRPGDSFRRQGVDYLVTRVYRKLDGAQRFVTTSKHGREIWF